MKHDPILIFFLVLHSVIILWQVWHIRKLKIELNKERKLLDTLDETCAPVIVNADWGNPYGEWVANEWHVEGPYVDVRKAIEKGLINKGN